MLFCPKPLIGVVYILESFSHAGKAGKILNEKKLALLKKTDLYIAKNQIGIIYRF